MCKLQVEHAAIYKIFEEGHQGGQKKWSPMGEAVTWLTGGLCSGLFVFHLKAQGTQVVTFAIANLDF